MPTTFQRCPPPVAALAGEILAEHESHKLTLDAKVKIDFVFAFSELNDQGIETKPALSKGGVKCNGICRKIPLKDRALDRGDVEISLDGRWWGEAGAAECRALLDHELHHIEVKTDENGICRDDLQRPIIKLRKHDYEFGWFTIIAARHGKASGEVQQARTMMEKAGQYYWPDLFEPPTGLRSPSTSVELVRAIDAVTMERDFAAEAIVKKAIANRKRRAA